MEQAPEALRAHAGDREVRLRDVHLLQPGQRIALHLQPVAGAGTPVVGPGQVRQAPANRTIDGLLHARRLPAVSTLSPCPGPSSGRCRSGWTCLPAIAGLGPFDDRRLARALRHHPVAGQGQGRLQQRRSVEIVAHQRPEQTHFLLHQCALVAMGKHRVEVDHLRRLAVPGAHQVRRVAAEQTHPRGDRRHVGIAPGALQAILEQGGDQRLALDQGYLATQAGEDEPIPAQAGRGIQDARADAWLDADRLGDHLPAAAAELAPVGAGAFDEIDPHRTGGIRPQLQDLQALLADLHGELRLVVRRQRQAEPLRPAPRSLGAIGGQGLDMQARSGGIGHGRAIVVESADFARVGPRALTGRPSIGPCRGGSDPGGRHCSRAPAPH